MLYSVKCNHVQDTVHKNMKTGRLKEARRLHHTSTTNFYPLALPQFREVSSEAMRGGKGEERERVVGEGGSTALEGKGTRATMAQ